MILSNTNTNKDRGFTIVELLIVIVIIGILAAITIVSYTGISQRANLASAQSAANSVIKKAEMYYADGNVSAYPATLSILTSAGSNETYALTGVTLQATALSAAPAKPNVINYYRCPSANATGIAVGYWNYTTSVINYIHSGTTTGGSSTTLGTGCVIVAS